MEKDWKDVQFEDEPVHGPGVLVIVRNGKEEEAEERFGDTTLQHSNQFDGNPFEFRLKTVEKIGNAIATKCLTIPVVRFRKNELIEITSKNRPGSSAPGVIALFARNDAKISKIQIVTNPAGASLVKGMSFVEEWCGKMLNRGETSRQEWWNHDQVINYGIISCSAVSVTN